MNTIETRKYEIANRKVEIRSLLNSNEEVNLDEIETELRNLDTELADLEKRSAIVGNLNTIEKPEMRKDNNMNENITYGVDSAEYRSAFLKKLQGKELNEVEMRAMTTSGSSAGAAIPTVTQNEIVRKVKEYAPLLSEITLLEVKGNVKYSVEGTNDEAALHTEGATITASGDTMVTVSLGGYEINKLLTISKSVSSMAIDAFETWLTSNLAEAVANKISYYLISGTGSSQPEGIEYAQTWGTTNSVTVAAASNLTSANVQTLVGLLPGGYDAGAKFLMSKKTLFTDFMPLQDNSKHDLVRSEGNSYFIYGYPVLIDERVTIHEAYLGNLKKAIVGNLAEVDNVVSQFDIDTNSFKYLGSAVFDSKVAVGEAVVKLVKAAA